MSFAGRRFNHTAPSAVKRAADPMAAHRKSDRSRDDPCAGGLRKRVQDSSMTSATLTQSKRKSDFNAILAVGTMQRREIVMNMS